MNKLSSFHKSLLGLSLATAATLASAVPTLQLGTLGGTYDAGTQTSISNGPVFDLYAFLNPAAVGSANNDAYANLNGYFRVSAAIVAMPNSTPLANTQMNLGSFTFGAFTKNVTTDMTYGIPPLDALICQTTGCNDPNNLQTHSVFPTFFTEFTFQFDGTLKKFPTNNVQDTPSLSPMTNATTSDGLYAQSFNVDVSNLAVGYEVHFDLYYCTTLTNGNCEIGNGADYFAPFSHDAQSGGTSSSTGRPSTGRTPEPSSSGLALMGLGLVGAGLWSRRRQRQA